MEDNLIVHSDVSKMIELVKQADNELDDILLSRDPSRFKELNEIKRKFGNEHKKAIVHLKIFQESNSELVAFINGFLEEKKIEFYKKIESF